MYKLIHSLLVAMLMVTAAWSKPVYPDYISTTECLPTDDVCEFILLIEERLTMMCITHECDLLIPRKGQLYNYNDKNFTSPLKDKAIQADGYYENPRIVLVANNSLPGPPIIVYEGQTVRVTVKNLMISEGVTVHWHGLHQKGSSHMDGVSLVSQCPILPGQTFVYKFKVDGQTGTYWYHAHNGAQRTQGIFGAFIIHPRPVPQVRLREHIMVVNDWNHDYDSNTGHLKMLYGIYDGNTRFNGHKSIDGSSFSLFRWQSGLVNGKGRYWYNESQHNEAPLEIFNITKNEKVRFRVISAGTLFPLRVSIDNHPLAVVASDGYDFEPTIVESFIINPGERFDFEVTADKPIGNYWIRVVSLEQAKNHIAEAILHYEGADLTTDYDKYTVSSRQDCSMQQCIVLNCPFENYAVGSNTKCLRIQDLNGLEGDAPSSDLEELFFNFGFPGESFTPGAVNGRQWQYPTASLASQRDEVDFDCDRKNCGEDKVCSCTNVMRLEYGKNYQFVFTNIGNNGGWAHPIHLHGHSFYVIKQGFSTMNGTTGLNIEYSKDLNCGGTKNFCNFVSWSNKSWSGDQLPDKSRKPIRKDTIMVPSGGYAVIRLKADNPGVWFMHCHIEIHNLDGMAMAFDEAPERQNAIPSEFPTCRNFISPSGSVISGEEGVVPVKDDNDDDDDDDDDDDGDDDDVTTDEYCFSKLPVILAFCAAGIVILMLLIIIISLYLYYKNVKRVG